MGSGYRIRDYGPGPGVVPQNGAVTKVTWAPGQEVWGKALQPMVLISCLDFHWGGAAWPFGECVIPAFWSVVLKCIKEMTVRSSSPFSRSEQCLSESVGAADLVLAGTAAGHGSARPWALCGGQLLACCTALFSPLLSAPPLQL